MSAQPVKRACDACHRRKVKCDGHNPCRNCGTAQLSCTYNAIPQKKGPKGSRAKVISELRETQRQTSLLTKVHNRIQGIHSPPMTPRQLPTPGFVTGELVKDCLDFFFSNMYAQMPILDRRTVEQQVMYMEQNRDAYCMLTALAAFTMIQPGKSMPVSPADTYIMDSMPMANMTSSELLMEEALRVRKGHEHLDTADGCVTLNTLATNFFLFACNDSIDMHTKAWYYLREATTMVLMSNMHKEQAYQKWDPAEAARRRRMFWLLFMTERAYALKHGRPVTLQATINLPTARDDPHDMFTPQVNEFVTRVTAFREFDNGLIDSWAKTRDTLPDIKSMQAQLDDVLRSLSCQDPHPTDLHPNLQWLQSTAWGLSKARDDSYPLDVLRDQVNNMASNFPDRQYVAGSGLIEKLFEITASLVDHLALQPASSHPFTTTPRDHLPRILNIVAALRNGCNNFVPLLVHVVGEALPKLADPMLQNPPEDSHMACIDDIFDGFGNAGIAPMQMTMENDRFQMVNYDDPFVSSGMHGSPSDSTHSPVSPSPTPPDMNSHFVTSVSSPAIMSTIMSPTMDFRSNNLNDYTCSPMAADMVMNPIGAPNGGGLGHPGSRHGLDLTAPSGMHSAMAHGINGFSPQSMAGQQHMGATSIPNSHHIGPGPGGGGGDMMRQQRPLPSMPPPSIYAMPQTHSTLPMHRNVGDFGSLQRVKPEAHGPMGQLTGMPSLDGSEMGFGNLR